MKTKNSLIIFPIVLLALSACGGNPSSGGGDPHKSDFIEPTIDENYYSNITERVAFNEESNLNFDDPITDALNDNVWNTLDGHWEAGGTEPHNGVRRRNLYYSKDTTGNGYLIMKSRGKYNREDSSTAGKAEGACIETKEYLGPGRYEVYMAAMPRDGGVTALWTFACPKSMATTQYEIDIEIGGGAQYTNLWCTTWLTDTSKATQSPDVTNICYMNDGRIHKYTFDWYTDFMGSGYPRIDWFIDEQHVQTIKKSPIPVHDMPLWLGVWMPSWAGSSEFIEDYLIIDRVSYKAFDPDTQWYTPIRHGDGSYSPRKPSESNIQNIDFDAVKNVNKISNSSCETIDNFSTSSVDYYGWKIQNEGGKIELSNEHTEGEKSFLVTCLEEKTTASGREEQWLYNQSIRCLYTGYEFDFSFDGKLASEDSVGKVIVEYVGTNMVTHRGQEEFVLDSTTFKTYSKHLTMPNKSGGLKIAFVMEKGSINLDNFSLVKTN